jgi:hypothetical protein
LNGGIRFTPPAPRSWANYINEVDKMEIDFPVVAPRKPH